MLTYPAKSNDDAKKVPPGSHIAFCNLIADIGLQPGSGSFPKPRHRLYVRFETPNERVEYEKDGKKKEGPLSVGSFYTASMSKKSTLRKHLESWRGRQFTDEEASAFDISAILGKPCMITVVHETKGGETYANITNIAPVPKGMQVPAGAENPLICYEPGDVSAYDRLPEWLRKKIDAQLVEQREVSSAEAAEFEDDQIPF